MHQRLPNYLRTFRRRTGLSQDEVAFLLGVRAGRTVSRHERRDRIPTAEELYGYEVIYGVPGRTLFAGVFEKVEATMIARAQALAEKLSAAPAGPSTGRKLTQLRHISSRPVRELDDLA